VDICKRSRTLSLAVLASALLVSAAIATSQCAQAADPALVAAAEKEGQLVVYGGDISETPHQVKRFAELYPKIKVTSVTMGGWQLYNRYMSEFKSGQNVADVFTNVEDTLLTLDAEGRLEAYTPAALKGYPSTTKVGNFVRTKLGYAALVSNTDEMKDAPVPDDWTSFANPPKSWDDKIAYVDPRGSSVAFLVVAAMVQNYGKDKAREIYEGLRRTRPEISMNTPASVSKVVSGERPLMMYILTNHIVDALKKGAPLKFKIPKSGAVPFYFAAGVLKGARHPNAARLYTEFMLEQGQDVIIARGEYALRPNSPAPKGLPALNEVKLMSVDVKKALAEQKPLIAWWQEVAGTK
jgi:iron(III) transport system substrate-binding protein